MTEPAPLTDEELAEIENVDDSDSLVAYIPYLIADLRAARAEVQRQAVLIRDGWEIIVHLKAERDAVRAEVERLRAEERWGESTPGHRRHTSEQGYGHP